MSAGSGVAPSALETWHTNLEPFHRAKASCTLRLLVLQALWQICHQFRSPM